jgi:hypothetical protein
MRFMAKTTLTVEHGTLMDLHMVRIRLCKEAGHEVTLNDALTRLIADWDGANAVLAKTPGGDPDCGAGLAGAGAARDQGRVLP